MPLNALEVYLRLYASVAGFIFVFMAIVTKIEIIQRTIFKTAQLSDYIVFILLFGLFSIFGTYIGIPSSYGAISNIRDLAPMVAGLVAGPYAGLAVGLIGGIHRLFLGGDTGIPCSLATVLAGVFAGMVYRFNKGKLLGIIRAMVFAVGIELLHGGLILLITRPFIEAVEIVRATTPQMIIANSLGLGVSIILLRDIIKVEGPSTPEYYFAGRAEEGGTGTTRMIDQMKKAGLPKPEFKEEMDGFSVYLYKDIYTEKYLRSLELNERQIRAVLYANEAKKITNKEYQELNRVSRQTAARELAALFSMHILDRIGKTGKSTYYRLNNK
jgi:hypothetical protein